MIFLPALVLGPLFLNGATATSLKVAIVGAGAGGSSASYWLSLAKQRAIAGTNVDITVYEQDNRVGGRSMTVYPYDDPTYAPIELGAAIFIKDNRNLVRAASEFGLDIVSPDIPVPGEGIWNGNKFVWRTTNSVNVDYDRFEERYKDGPTESGKLYVGMAFINYIEPNSVLRRVAKFLDYFANSYRPTFPQFSTVAAYASTVKITPLETITFRLFLSQRGVNLKWINDFVTGRSRINYAQDVSTMNGVAGMISLAPDTAYSVKTGNSKIFEQLLSRSGAFLQLETTVKSVTKSLGHQLKYRVETNKGAADFDAVIIAAPLPLSNIEFVNTAEKPSSKSFPKVSYLRLHVTLLTTTASSPLPTYFKVDNSMALPGIILTTAEYSLKPEFHSIGYQASIKRNGRTEYVVKIFSRGKISDETLKTLFGETTGWVFRKEWDAYPYYPPHTDHPPLKIDKGLYYINSMESLMSTMETETISSRNVVDLLSTELLGSGLCGPDGAKGPVTDTYVLGWDC